MNSDPRQGHKIGVLVPYTNVNLEPDMAMMCPAGCTLHLERLGDYDIDEIPGSDQMARLGASDLTETLRLISANGTPYASTRAAVKLRPFRGNSPLLM